jgi:hypothetical protein
MRGNCLDFPGQRDAIRFHVVVFNFERIHSFLDNLYKIKNFRPDRDRIIILDCSRDHAAQKKVAEHFDKNIKVIRRRNWGIDQGARIDYFTALRRMRNPPQFIWQFQEHYLDLEAPWSIWPKDTPRIGGKLKADTIPDDLEIDLDHCERVYTDNPHVSVIYADRAKLGVFTHQDGREWFYADGANFSARTGDVLEAFPFPTLSTYKSIYDGSYQWTLFMELDICGRLTRAGRDWYDLVTHEHFDTPENLRRRENEKQRSLHQSAEPFYADLYRNYETRFERFRRASDLRRSAEILRSTVYLNLRESMVGTAARRIVGFLAGKRVYSHT